MRKHNSKITTAAVLALLMVTALLIVGCGGGSRMSPIAQAPTGTGTLSVKVQWPEGTRAIPDETTYITITVTGSGDQPWQNTVDRNPGETEVQTSFTNLLPGTRLVVAEAYNASDEKIGIGETHVEIQNNQTACLLYTSPSPRDRQRSRMPSSA